MAVTRTVAELTTPTLRIASVPADHVYVHQVGPDQEGFFRFWEKELQPRLAKL